MIKIHNLIDKHICGYNKEVVKMYIILLSLKYRHLNKTIQIFITFNNTCSHPYLRRIIYLRDNGRTTTK